MSSRLERISWMHPRLGRMSEAACRDHASQILRALRTLGIGGSGESANPQAECLRCLHGDYDFRAFSDQAVVKTEVEE
jgi:hypothetical protein